MLYSELLNPSYIAWILWIGGDPFQHYLGWELFRDASWTFPVGLNTHLAYPVGVPLTFTDSIPLFSIAFKLFRNVLPFPFQFFGIWMLLCFVLQGVFGYLVVKQAIDQKTPPSPPDRGGGTLLLAIFSSIFFILSPIMLFRLGGHSALGAHWLILWSLWLALQKYGQPRMAHWTAVLSLAVLIHPYLLFMCAALFLADLARRAFVLHVVAPKRAVAFFAVEILLIVSIAYVIGVFSAGGGSAPGYGVFSLDLNALVNPYGFSTIIQNMRVREPNEGFNYLGLGIILLAILSAYEYLWTAEHGSIREVWRRWWPLIVVAALLTLVAVTHVVSAWGREAIHLPLPASLRDNVFGIVRSSGRLFWPVYYLVMLGSFFVVQRLRRPFAGALLVFALALQIYDMKDKLTELNHFYENRTWESPLRDPFWQNVARRYRHISFIPAFAHGRFDPIAMFAAEHGLSLNAGPVARSAGDVNAREMREERNRLMSGDVDAETLYIFLNGTMKDIEEIKDIADKTIGTHVIDGYAVLDP